jgi:hypothetical protein
MLSARFLCTYVSQDIDRGFWSMKPDLEFVPGSPLGVRELSENAGLINQTCCQESVRSSVYG